MAADLAVLQVEREAYYRRLLTEPRYFAKHELKVVNEQAQLVPFGDMIATQAMVQDEIDAARRERRPCWLFILKARRHRISYAVGANEFHGVWANDNFRALTIGMDEDNTKYLGNMHRVFYDKLRDDIRPETRVRNKDEFSFAFDADQVGATLQRAGTQSSILTQCAGGGGRVGGNVGQGAKGIGRGEMFQIVHASEVAFWPNGGDIAQGLFATLPMSPDVLVVGETTANGMAGYAYETWLDAVKGLNQFKPIFLPWFAHPHYTSEHLVAMGERDFAVTDDQAHLYAHWLGALATDDAVEASRLARRLDLHEEEVRLARMHQVTLDQLWWRRWCIRKLGGGGKGLARFHVEYPSTPEEAFAASGTPRYDNVKIYSILRSPGGMVQPPDEGWFEVRSPAAYNPMQDAAKPADVRFRSVRSDYQTAEEPLVCLFEPPEPTRSYIVSADVADGVGGDADASVLTVLRRRLAGEPHSRVVATLGSNRVKPDKLAWWMLLLAWHYRGGVREGALLAPEVNNQGGGTLIGALVASGYRRIYMRQRLDRVNDRWGTEPGWKTDSATRDALISRVDVAIANDEIWHPDARFWEQCITFVRHPPATDWGKARDDHMRGCHDDYMVSGGIALCVDALSPPDTIVAQNAVGQPMWGSWAQTADGGDDEELEGEGSDDALLERWMQLYL